ALREAGDALAALGPGEVVEVTAGRGASQGVARGAYVRLAAHEPRLSPAQERAVAAMLDRFRAEPFSPPTRPEVETELGPEVTALLLDRGTLVKVSDAILLDRAAYEEAVRRVVGHLRAHGTLTVAEARDLLHTSRKYMLAIFEHLDERRITQRSGDDRVLGPNAVSLAEAAPGDVSAAGS